MQAVLAGLSMGPKEYFGELLQRRRWRRIWLTTGHDKYCSSCLTFTLPALPEGV